MNGIRRVILNALLAAAVTTGFAIAQDDAPPPPDSQYPAASDSGQYATPDSATMPAPNQDQYPSSAQSAPPAAPDTANEPPSTAPNDYPGTAQPSTSANDQPSMAQQAPPPPASADNGTAAPSNEAATDAQDPSRRVARMQFMDGQVSIQPGGVNDWVAGTLNRPMTTGDNVWTDKDSKAELNVGTGVFRMGAETSVTLANVGDNTTQLQLHQGVLNLRVRHLYNGEVYEVDTPNMAFTVQQPGDYRFDVDPNADTSFVTVWKGEGNATGDGPSVAVRQGERAKFSSGTSMAYEIDKAPAYDQFDEWAMNRDRRDENSVSARYVSPDVIGSSDLDDYGTWQDNQQYGNVWVPNDQSDDWQPYSDGNWVYQQPYGWTWVDYEPWGFAPYHYGRWVYGGWGWGWAPGPYVAWGAPYYAPALVAWFGGGWGWGANWGFGFGGGWGWCALGWGEPFHPWYNAGPGYWNHINGWDHDGWGGRGRWGHDGWGGRGGWEHGRGYGDHGRGYGDHGRGYNTHFANFNRGLVATNGRTLQNGLPVRGNRLNLTGQQRNAFLQHPMNARNVSTQLRPTAASRVGARAMGRPAVTPPSRAISRPTVARLNPGTRGGTAMASRGFNGRPAAALNNGRSGAMNNHGIAANNRGAIATRNGMAMNNRGGNPSMRNVPRPPNATVNRGGMPGARGFNGGASRPSGSTMASGHYVPRPPSAGGTIGNRGSANMPSAMGRSGVPRPNGGAYTRPGSGAYSRPGQSYSAPRSSMSLGRAYSSPSYGARAPYGGGRSYSSPYGGGRNYASPSYGARNYGSPYGGGNRAYSSPAPHYSSPSMPRYSAPSMPRGGGFGGGHAAPAYRGGGFGGGHAAPAYRGGGFGGGHAAPAFHGGGGGFGGGRSAPSFHGGGGGGGHFGGGGGGGHFGGGGGHSGGGGHGGHR